MTDPEVRAAIHILLNIVEILMDKCAQQAETIQQLKDEINRLRESNPNQSRALMEKAMIIPQKKIEKRVNPARQRKNALKNKIRSKLI